MSWSIALIENTATVPVEGRVDTAYAFVEVADHLWEVRADQEDCPWSGEQIVAAVLDEDGKIIFDPDSAEHMDFLTHDDRLCRALARNGAKGRILFGSLEGDNKSSFWGVEFASGHYRRLTATAADINWSIGTSIPG